MPDATDCLVLVYGRPEEADAQMPDARCQMRRCQMPDARCQKPPPDARCNKQVTSFEYVVKGWHLASNDKIHQDLTSLNMLSRGGIWHF